MLAIAHEALSWVLIWIAPVMFVLTLIVTVHELGHFTAARLFGVAVDQFSIGFGRALFSRKDRSGVEWRIGWIPLGGYVRFAGDENAASVPDAEDLAALRREIIAREGPAAIGRYFHFKPVWQRAIIAAAGPFANFVLSSAVFAILLMTVGEPTPPARVAAVVPGSAAQAAGFRPGDLVVSAADHKVGTFFDLQEIIAVRAGVPIRFVVRREDTDVILTATPTAIVQDDPISGRQTIGRLGVGPSVNEADFAPHRFGPMAAIGGGVVRTWKQLDTITFYLGRLVRGQVSADQLGGPLRTAQISHNMAQAGSRAGHTLGEHLLGELVALLDVVAFISVGIGFMNLLPIPVLDGGHLVFYAYEAVVRRPVGAAVQAVSYRVGLALLLGLMLFATTNDLQRSSVFHFLGGLFS
jgi:regulator of sigma E protease